MEHEAKDKPKYINVRVVTTSGTYPANGHEKVPLDEPVSAILGRVAAALGITDASVWVAKVGGRAVETGQTYAALGLKGEVKIDFGPNEGGGGSRASTPCSKAL